MQSIDEMLASAKAVKGDAFATAVSGIFECMQAAWVLGAITRIANDAGSGVSGYSAIACQMIGAAATRLADLAGKDSDEAVELSKRMMSRRGLVEREVLYGRERAG